MVVGKRYVIVKNFEGEPKPGDLMLEEFEVPPLKDKEILVKSEFLSVDPYMRPYSARLSPGQIMIGSQVGEVIESKNNDWSVGSKIVCNSGWVTHIVLNPESDEQGELFNYKPYPLPAIDELPISLALGMLGMPGHTAYFGFFEICQPDLEETVVVSGAAGAVGSHVGQMAKIVGLKVIGIAGSEEKCKWLTDELGFDHAINYKTENVAEALKKAAPNGIDIYFDNVGGEISSTVMSQMNDFGRVSVCGSISAYNNSPLELPKATILQPAMVFHQLKVEGFIVLRWKSRFSESLEQSLSWIREGKLKYKETVTKGFENMYEAFRDMLKGGNIGKAIVEV